jgi:hypothetical protein
MRRAALMICPGWIRPVCISATNPWNVWKLSRPTTVTSTSPRRTARAIARTQ